MVGDSSCDGCICSISRRESSEGEGEGLGRDPSAEGGWWPPGIMSCDSGTNDCLVSAGSGKAATEGAGESAGERGREPRERVAGDHGREGSA